MRQYEIWWADLPPPIGRRPVLLLTRTPAYAYRNKVVVAEISRTMRHIPQEVPLGAQEGLPSACVANLDNIHVVPLSALSEAVGRLGRGRHHEVKRAVGWAFDWGELKAL